MEINQNKDEIKLDVPLIHSDAELCHVDSLSMILRYMGDRYEPWYIGGASGRFFGFGYYPSKEFVQIRTGTFPLKAYIRFLKNIVTCFNLFKESHGMMLFPF